MADKGKSVSRRCKNAKPTDKETIRESRILKAQETMFRAGSKRTWSHEGGKKTSEKMQSRQGNDQKSRILKAQKTMFRAGSKRTWSHEGGKKTSEKMQSRQGKSQGKVRPRDAKKREVDKEMIMKEDSKKPQHLGFPCGPPPWY